MANKTGNITWIAGGESPNKYGRKLARQTITAAIERFLKKNLTEKKLQTLYDTLTPREQLQLNMMLLPYVKARIAEEKVSQDQIDNFFQRLETKQVSNG